MIELRMNLVFFGSSAYSLPALISLLKNNYQPIVVSTPDKPAGRGLKIQPNPLANYAQKNRLTTLKPDKLDQNSLKDLKRLNKNIKLGVCSVYGKIIPESWLKYFPLGIINLHPSLLPLYRGPSPAQYALLNNEGETGISFIKMDKECDHGPILAQFKEIIYSQDTAGSLYERLFSLAAKELPLVIKSYLKNKLKLITQNHSQASFTKMIKKEDGFVPLKDLKLALKNYRPGQALDLKRRAFTPWPGIYTHLKINGQEKRLKILKTCLKKGKLVIDEVQLEGKAPISFSRFSDAYSSFL